MSFFRQFLFFGGGPGSTPPFTEGSPWQTASRAGIRLLLLLAAALIGLGVLVLLFPRVLAFGVAGLLFLTALWCLRAAWGLYRTSRTGGDSRRVVDVSVSPQDRLSP
jgi:hypothetical protein